MKPKVYFLCEDIDLLLLAKIIEKVYNSSNGKRIFVACSNNELKTALDKKLWTFSSTAFIPHGLDTDPANNEQPILLCNFNHAIPHDNILIIITNNEGCSLNIVDFKNFAEVFILTVNLSLNQSKILIAPLKLKNAIANAYANQKWHEVKIED